MNEKRDRLDSLIKQVLLRMKKPSPEPGECPNDETMAAYMNGGLTQEEREKVEAHFTLCEECTDQLISSTTAKDSYPSTDETFTTDKMLKRAQALVKQPETTPFWEKIVPWFTPLRPKPVMVGATVFVVILVFGIVILQEYSPEIPPLARFSLIARIPLQGTVRGTPKEYKEVEIKDGGVLHSGDMIKIQFRLQEEAYVYLISLDSQGNLNRLLPSPDTEALKKFKADETYYFPEKNLWLELDDHPGKEVIYLISSPDPIIDIDRIMDEIKKSGIDKVHEILPKTRIQAFHFEHK